jgi:hypothetical protein
MISSRALQAPRRDEVQAIRTTRVHGFLMAGHLLRTGAIGVSA